MTRRRHTRQAPNPWGKCILVKGVRTPHTERHLQVITLRSCSPHFRKPRGREGTFSEESSLKDAMCNGSIGRVRFYWGRGRRGRCGREDIFWAYWESGSHFMGKMACVLDLKCLPQASGRPKWYDSAAENKVFLRLTSEVKKSGSFSSVTHFTGKRLSTAGGRDGAQMQTRQDCEQRHRVRWRPACPSSFALSYRHKPDFPPSVTCPSMRGGPYSLNSRGN